MVTIKIIITSYIRVHTGQGKSGKVMEFKAESGREIGLQKNEEIMWTLF